MTVVSDPQKFDWASYLNDLAVIQQYFGANVSSLLSLTKLLNINSDPLLWQLQLLQQFQQLALNKSTDIFQL